MALLNAIYFGCTGGAIVTILVFAVPSINYDIRSRCFGSCLFQVFVIFFAMCMQSLKLVRHAANTDEQRTSAGTTNRSVRQWRQILPATPCVVAAFLVLVFNPVPAAMEICGLYASVYLTGAVALLILVTNSVAVFTAFTITRYCAFHYVEFNYQRTRPLVDWLFRGTLALFLVGYTAQSVVTFVVVLRPSHANAWWLISLCFVPPVMSLAAGITSISLIESIRARLSTDARQWVLCIKCRYPNELSQGFCPECGERVPDFFAQH